VRVVDVPEDVQAVLARFLSSELATVGRDGGPVAVPPWLPERGQVLLTTTIGFAVEGSEWVLTPTGVTPGPGVAGWR
jgi:hypothetical protein